MAAKTLSFNLPIALPIFWQTLVLRPLSAGATESLTGTLRQGSKSSGPDRWPRRPKGVSRSNGSSPRVIETVRGGLAGSNRTSRRSGSNGVETKAQTYVPEPGRDDDNGDRLLVNAVFPWEACRRSKAAGDNPPPLVQNCGIVSISSPTKYACNGKTYTSF